MRKILTKIDSLDRNIVSIPGVDIVRFPVGFHEIPTPAELIGIAVKQVHIWEPHRGEDGGRSVANRRIHLGVH